MVVPMAATLMDPWAATGTSGPMDHASCAGLKTWTFAAPYPFEKKKIVDAFFIVAARSFLRVAIAIRGLHVKMNLRPFLALWKGGGAIVRWPVAVTPRRLHQRAFLLLAAAPRKVVRAERHHNIVHKPSRDLKTGFFCQRANLIM